MLSFLLDLIRFALGAAVLLVFLYVPGAVALNVLSLRQPAPFVFTGVEEWLFSAVLISVLATGTAGFVLAEAGLFQGWTALLLVLGLCLVMAAIGQVRMRLWPLLVLLRVPASYPQRMADRRQARTQRVTLIVTLVVAAALFSRPAEMLRGALDSGVYVNAGVALARTGAIFQRDTLMRQLNDDAGEGKELLVGLNPDRYTLDRLRMPGFYVYDKKAALVVPQHYFLYPTWIGLMHSLFGIWGALYATPLLMLLAVAAVYFFARRAFSPGAALVGLALLILCPVTIWFARYPVSEVITGLLAFSAFYAFMRMVQLAQERDAAPPDEESPPDILHAESARRAWASLWGMVAGLSLGQLALARPDFIFYLAPVPLYLLYWRFARAWRRPYTWFAWTLLAVLGLFAVHYFFYSYPYTLDLYHNTLINLRRNWQPILVAFFLGLLLLVTLDRLYPRLRPLWRRVSSLAVRYRWAWAGGLVLLVGAYALYHYGIGPWLQNNRVDSAGRPLTQAYVTTLQSYIGAQVDLGSRYNLLRIGWYLSPPGVVLGVAGLLRWIWDRLDAASGLFFGTLLVVGFVFIQETYTDAHYIYTMRRYVPVILPALILGVAWTCQFLWSRIKPRQLGLALASVIVVGLAAFFVYTDRVIAFHVEEQGAVARLSELANRFEGKTVVLFSNERDEPYVVATPLQYIFGVESFALARPYPNVNNVVLQNIVTRWISQGYKVYAMLGANGGKLDLPSFSLKEEGSWSYDVREFQQLYYQKPNAAYTTSLPWGIYSLQPRAGAAQPTLPMTIDVGGMDYKYLVAGFYRQERAESDPSDRLWRWTGDYAIMRLPWPTQPGGKTLEGGKLTLRLRPESPAEGEPIRRTAPVTVTLALEDTPIGQVVVRPGTQFKDYTINVPPGINKTGSAPDTVLLHVRAPTWSVQGPGGNYDMRALGIQIDSVTISR